MSYERKIMKKRPIKIVKRNHGAGSKARTEVVSIGNHKRWSKAIRSWVDDSRQRTERESFRKFDSLFKDAPPGVDFPLKRNSSASLLNNDLCDEL